MVIIVVVIIMVIIMVIMVIIMAIMVKLFINNPKSATEGERKTRAILKLRMARPESEF